MPIKSFIFYHFKIPYTKQKLADIFNNILCYCKALNNKGNKWLLIDV